jgi:gas vesicle protein
MSKSTTFHLIMFGLGSVLGILFAPRAGTYTRARIARQARKQQRLLKAGVAAGREAIDRGMRVVTS